MNIKKGLAALALALVSWAAQAEPFVASKDGSMILDKATGLVWMRCSLGQKWDGKGCAGAAKEFRFPDAQVAAEHMNGGGGYGGYRDWRLPSVRQLSLLIKCSSGDFTKKRSVGDSEGHLSHTCPSGFVSPTADPLAWMGTAPYYWSSTPHPDFAGSAWGVGFFDGSVDSSSHDAAGAVRLVRVSDSATSADQLFTAEIPKLEERHWQAAAQKAQAVAIAEKESRYAEERRALEAYQATERKVESDRIAAKRRAEEAERAAIASAIRKGPQQLYLLAGQSQRGKSIEINGRSFGTTELYELIVDKFPTSEYAVKATDQLTAMDRSDRSRAAAYGAAEAQRQADQNASNRAQCFSQVRSCEANCNSAWSSDYRMAQSCVTRCQRTCN